MRARKYFILLLSLLPALSYGRSGAVDYSWGAQALHEMNVYVLAMMTAVVDLLCAIGALMVLYSGYILFTKISSGEQGMLKSAAYLLGSILFLLFSFFLLPAFFGIRLFN